YRRNEAVVKTNNQTTITTPICLTVDDAAEIVQKFVFNTWAQRLGFTFPTSRRLLKYSPTDILTLQFPNGDTYTARVTKIDVGADWVVSFELQWDFPEVWVS